MCCHNEQANGDPHGTTIDGGKGNAPSPEPAKRDRVRVVPFRGPIGRYNVQTERRSYTLDEAKVAAEALAEKCGLDLCPPATSPDEPWPERSCPKDTNGDGDCGDRNCDCRTRPSPTAKAGDGVARVEAHGARFVVRVDGNYFRSWWSANDDNPRTLNKSDATWFNDEHIAQAVADAINRRNGFCEPGCDKHEPHGKCNVPKPTLADRLAAADKAADAKVTARMAADLGVTNEIAAQVAEAFKPFADLKNAMSKYRAEMAVKLDTLGGEIVKTNRRIDRLKVVDPGHN